MQTITAQEDKRMKTMKPGTRLNPSSSVGHWEGVLRDGSGRVVWACGHLHKCRDQNSRIHGKAARRCAEDALRLLKHSKLDDARAREDNE